MIHDHAVAAYTPRFTFTEAQLLEIFTLQAAANNVMSDAWRTSTNDQIAYYRAAAVETFEAIQHIGFKWWKSETPNNKQAELELIDMLHFAASHYLRINGGDPAATVNTIISMRAETEFCAIARYKDKVFSGPLFERFPDNAKYSRVLDISAFSHVDILEQYIFSTLALGAPNWNMLRALFDAFGMSAAKAHALYVSKNALNTFRTDNGQREGTYMKIWNGREDNEHLYEFVIGRADQGETLVYQDIYNFLVDTYSNVSLSKG